MPQPFLRGSRYGAPCQSIPSRAGCARRMQRCARPDTGPAEEQARSFHPLHMQLHGMPEWMYLCYTDVRLLQGVTLGLQFSAHSGYSAHHAERCECSLHTFPRYRQQYTAIRWSYFDRGVMAVSLPSRTVNGFGWLLSAGKMRMTDERARREIQRCNRCGSIFPSARAACFPREAVSRDPVLPCRSSWQPKHSSCCHLRLLRQLWLTRSPRGWVMQQC